MSEAFIPTREGVERLKRDWEKDPAWDIEDTEGFEAYYEELRLYRELKEIEWRNEYEVKRAKLSDLETIKDHIEHATKIARSGASTKDLSSIAIASALVALCERLDRITIGTKGSINVHVTSLP
jgi:hypothetical protein